MFVAFPHHDKDRELPACYSLTRERRPDLLIRVRGPSVPAAWVVLDAKYVEPDHLAEEMEKLHRYRDCLWMEDHGGRCRAGLLLTPAAPVKVGAWASPAFRDRYGLGVWPCRPGTDRDPSLARWLLDRLGIR